MRYHGTWCRRPIAMPSITAFPMVSVRTIIGSPFDSGTIYWGGYDCNSHPKQDTAWCATSSADDITTAVTTAVTTQEAEIEEEEGVQEDAGETKEDRFHRFKLEQMDEEETEDEPE